MLRSAIAGSNGGSVLFGEISILLSTEVKLMAFSPTLIEDPLSPHLCQHWLFGVFSACTIFTDEVVSHGFRLPLTKIAEDIY